MKNSIFPCLWFNGTAKQAAEYYCTVFRDASIITDTPMVVNFQIFGKKIMGLNGGPNFKINPSISFFVLLESIKETNSAWEKLAEGGNILMPINKYPWSDRYGWLQDKFGMTWQIAVVNKTGNLPSLTASLLFTNKQFGRAEEAMHLYLETFPESSIPVLLHYPENDPNFGKVMFSEFRLNEYNLIAMDGPGQHEYTFNEGVSLVVTCTEQNEIDHYWNSLVANGGAEGRCGWLKDPFGVSWQIIPADIGKWMNRPEKGKKVMQELLNMNKLDLKTLEKASM